MTEYWTDTAILKTKEKLGFPTTMQNVIKNTTIVKQLLPGNPKYLLTKLMNLISKKDVNPMQLYQLKSDAVISFEKNYLLIIMPNNQIRHLHKTLQLPYSNIEQGVYEQSEKSINGKQHSGYQLTIDTKINHFVIFIYNDEHNNNQSNQKTMAPMLNTLTTDN